MLLLIIAVADASASVPAFHPDYSAPSSGAGISRVAVSQLGYPYTCFNINLNVQNVTLRVMLDSSISDLLIPNVGINAYSGTKLNRTRPIGAQNITGKAYGTGNWTGFGFQGSVSLPSTNVTTSNAPAIAVIAQTSSYVFSYSTNQGRLGLGFAPQAYFNATPPTVIDAWAASYVTSSSSVGFRMCQYRNSSLSFVDFGSLALAPSCNASIPQIAWINSPVPSTYTVNVRSFSVNGTQVQLNSNFQANGTWSRIETCEKAVYLPTEAFTVYKNALIASGGLTTDAAQGFFTASASLGVVYYNIKIDLMPNITFEFISDPATNATVSITLGPRQYIYYDGAVARSLYVDGQTSSRVVFGTPFFIDVYLLFDQHNNDGNDDNRFDSCDELRFSDTIVIVNNFSDHHDHYDDHHHNDHYHAFAFPDHNDHHDDHHNDPDYINDHHDHHDDDNDHARLRFSDTIVIVNNFSDHHDHHHDHDHHHNHHHNDHYHAFAFPDHNDHHDDHHNDPDYINDHHDHHDDDNDHARLRFSDTIVIVNNFSDHHDHHHDHDHHHNHHHNDHYHAFAFPDHNDHHDDHHNDPDYINDHHDHHDDDNDHARLRFSDIIVIVNIFSDHHDHRDDHHHNHHHNDHYHAFAFPDHNDHHDDHHNDPDYNNDHHDDDHHDHHDDDNDHARLRFSDIIVIVNIFSDHHGHRDHHHHNDHHNDDYYNDYHHAFSNDHHDHHNHDGNHNNHDKPRSHNDALLDFRLNLDKELDRHPHSR
ncbi:hypothetical protein HK105_203660 [Polyrhizophydium stewartii]|uniref:Peptidase A1 domain-containing protein n=1 Tax=Polyrhizophydium stewartii TaxID=2732419 RepID=A0ABR4NBK6_9FUNG